MKKWKIETDEDYDQLSDDERRKIRQALFDHFATLTMEEQFEED